MFDLLKLIAKKEELQLALEGVAELKQTNYRNMMCADCSAMCRSTCSSACKDSDAGSCRRLIL